MRKTGLAVAAGLMCSLWMPAATIFVVRHAERADSGMAAGATADPELSAAGQARAKELARVLKDAGVKRIFTTELKRTQQTAAQLAELAGVKPVVITAKDVAGLVKALKALGDGEVALVVGHSNTVPDIAGRLTGTAQPEMAETEFDRLIIVETTGKPSAVALRYGAK